nr:N-acetyltransferase [Bacteroidota bacterium]
MNIRIKSETKQDYRSITLINDDAFGQKTEGILINSLRMLEGYNPQLSLIAFADQTPVGHILFFPVKIQTATASYECLSLAPIAVISEFQKEGIGGRLIKHGLKKAGELGYDSVFVLGHPGYYPRFGFEKANTWGIGCPWEVPDEAWMAIELIAGSLKGKQGMVVFPTEYDEAV